MKNPAWVVKEVTAHEDYTLLSTRMQPSDRRCTECVRTAL